MEEFRNLKKIKHSNIVQVHKLFIDKNAGKMYYVMEYVEAKEMLEVLKELNQYSGGELRGDSSKKLFCIRSNRCEDIQADPFSHRIFTFAGDLP